MVRLKDFFKSMTGPEDTGQVNWGMNGLNIPLELSSGSVTFDKICGIENDFTKFLKESC